MLGRVVDLQPVGEPLGLRRGNASYSDAGVWVFRLSITSTTLGVGIVPIHQVPDAVRPVDPGAPLGHVTCRQPRSGSNTRNRLHTPLPLVLVVLACRPAGRGGAAVTSASSCRWSRPGRPAGGWVVRPGVHVQHVLHAPHELGVLLGRDAPPLLQPRLEPVCLRPAAPSHARGRSTTSTHQPVGQQAQRPPRRPSGGGAAGQGDQLGFLRPIELAGICARAVCVPAPRQPAVTNCWRTRETVAGWTSNASAMAASSSRAPPRLIRFEQDARVGQRRAGATPCPISVRNCARSGSDNITMCRLRTWVSSGGGIPGPHEPSPQATHHANHHCQATSTPAGDRDLCGWAACGGMVVPASVRCPSPECHGGSVHPFSPRWGAAPAPVRNPRAPGQRDAAGGPQQGRPRVQVGQVSHGVREHPGEHAGAYLPWGVRGPAPDLGQCRGRAPAPRHTPIPASPLDRPSR